MDDVKRGLREVGNKAKEFGRELDGHDAGDDVGNLGDDIRRDLGNAGDDARRAADDVADRADDEADRRS
jgi:hypothetical protein